jgi:SAM-dependent methyltransferase
VNSQEGENDHNRRLLADANRRLYPSLTDPSYLILRSRRIIFSRWVSNLRENLVVLDIGGRYQPYRPLFGSKISRYIAIDLIKTGLLSVVADGEALPFAPSSFDVVIATQVIDYFPNPCRAVAEIHSVLKPGGVLLASVPNCAPRFADNELWRFTRPGLRVLLSSFDQIELVPELHSLSSLIRTMNLGLDTFVRYNSARWLYRRTACPILNLTGLAIENLDLTSNDQFTSNYSVRAVKTHC